MNRAWKIAHTNLRDPENIVLLDNSNAALTEKYLSDTHGVKKKTLIHTDSKSRENENNTTR